MRNFFLQFFTWWNGQTLGTRLYTAFAGELVGEDEAGNLYYRRRGGRRDRALGFERRWVVYNGEADASRIPPGWHGWLHRVVDTPPAAEIYDARSWEQPHRPNMTGTPGAYRPQGSLLTPQSRPRVTGDYDAWSPGS